MQTFRITDETRDVLEESLIRYQLYLEQERETANDERRNFCDREIDLLRIAFTDLGLDPDCAK